MTENIIEKGKAPDKTTEDTVMTTEPMTTEEGAREPSSKRWKKPHAYFERCRALAREKHRTCQERRRPRKVGIEPLRERDPALPQQHKRNKRHRTRKRARKDEKDVLAAARPSQEPPLLIQASILPPPHIPDALR
ncbi:hypothetical protein PENNAL_c0001G09977 [Penicillium nalgiovense]|uniref:Uncharacterized protein n=1 Tax=Penicillium nalgiovense TaxID=60175 RepID=A0A1V6Z9B9_PENNA|nr:hypothetical protein PENNAL_c0001G09977 [Penicillium nalgiovense]